MSVFATSCSLEATSIVERSEKALFPFSRHEVLLKRPIGGGYIKNPQTIGNHIRNRRLELKKSQREVAVLFGVHMSTVLHWEAGTKKPKAKHDAAITDFLGYEPECVAALQTPQTKLRQKALS